MKLRTVLFLATMLLGVVLLSGVVLAKDKYGDSKPNKLMGTKGTDRIYGGDGGDELGGKEGRDWIYGQGGGDLMHGGLDRDTVKGGLGTDTAWGDEGTDELIAEHKHKGSYQAAKVKGGRKPDKLLGGRGNDTIRAKNGKKDIIRGGPGYDKAYVDPVDTVKGVEAKHCGGCNKPPGNKPPGNKPPGNKPPGNKPPVAKKDSYSTGYYTMLNEPAPGVLGNDRDVDGDALTAVHVSGPSHGTLNLNADGSFTYDPEYEYWGTDSFTYKANDGTVDSNRAATVTINVGQ